MQMTMKLISCNPDTDLATISRGGRVVILRDWGNDGLGMVEWREGGSTGSKAKRQLEK